MSSHSNLEVGTGNWWIAGFWDVDFLESLAIFIQYLVFNLQILVCLPFSRAIVPEFNSGAIIRFQADV